MKTCTDTAVDSPSVFTNLRQILVLTSHYLLHNKFYCVQDYGLSSVFSNTAYNVLKRFPSKMAIQPILLITGCSSVNRLLFIKEVPEVSVITFRFQPHLSR